MMASMETDQAMEAMPAPAAQPQTSVIQFDASQKRLFLDRARVIVVNWHRQKGKDFTAAAKACDGCLQTGQDWFIVSLTQRQADATFAKCKKVAKALQAMLGIVGAQVESNSQFEGVDPETGVKFTYTQREIRFPNGARVVSLPGRDPDTVAGLTGNLILTEFGLFPNGGYAHWSVIFPISTRGFQVVIISTPRGKNTKFFELWSDTELYSVHTCDLYQSVNEEGFILKDNNGQITTIEHFRRLYKDEGKWPREYECKFTGDLEALISWAKLLTAAELGAGRPFDFLRIDGAGWKPEFFKSHARSFGGGRLEMGWDVARTGHLSSLWVNLAKPRQPKSLRFLVLMHDAEFALQRAVVQAAMDARGRGSGVGAGDATGLGMDSNETLRKRYGERWEPVTFGVKTKSDLGSIGATTYGDQGQALPSMDGPFKFIATDLYAVQRAESGGQDRDARLRLEETDNLLMPESHCDIAYSNLLALRAGLNPKGKTLPPPLRVKPVGW